VKSVQVQADVVDITCDTPRPGDRFVVDTNVWVRMVLASGARAATQRQQRYAPYLKSSRRLGAKLLVPSLVLWELARTAERAEFDLWSPSGNVLKEFKDFRCDPVERPRVAKLIQRAWMDVLGLATLIDTPMDSVAAFDLIKAFPFTVMDPYDLCIVGAAKKAGVTMIITDDADYGSLSGIQVFTNNGFLLTEAKQQGRCISRPAPS
jgi:predicted nucleic acid-binding protein